MLGMPTDVYLTGSMMFWMPIVIAIAIPIKAYIILPLLQDLGILSINEVLIKLASKLNMNVTTFC